MELDSLYQEIILDHYRQPRNKCSMADGIHVKHDNPLCGDEIALCLQMDDNKVRRVCFTGHGCSISQASSSMMTEAVAGLTADEALQRIEQIREMMHGTSPADDLGDIMALEGVANFPVRVKCALLPWMALKDALSQSHAVACKSQCHCDAAGTTSESEAHS